MKTWLRLTTLVPLVACSPAVCHIPSTSVMPSAGDANGDGTVDISDGILIERYLLSGGPNPVCDGAADASGDGTVDVNDGLTIWNHLFLQTATLPALAADHCKTPKAVPNGETCGAVSLSIDGADNQAVVTLHSDIKVEGWQFAVMTSGCGVESSALPDAITRQQPSDRLGYSWNAMIPEGASTAVVLSYLEPVSLPVGDTPLLTLNLLPAGPGCHPCTLEVEEGAVVSAQGFSYVATRKTGHVKVCGDK